MATVSYLSIITLNVNGLNAPTKIQRLAEWIQKQDPYICCLQETNLKTNGDQKKAGVAIFISDKIDFKAKAVERDKEGHYIMITGSIQEEDIKNYKYICTQHWSTATHKANANKY